MHQSCGIQVLSGTKLLPCTGFLMPFLLGLCMPLCLAVCSLDAIVEILPGGGAVGLFCLHGSGLPSWQPILAAHSPLGN